MKYGTLILLCFAIFVAGVNGQDDGMSKRAAEVRTAIGKHAVGGKFRVRVVRYDLRVQDGRVVSMDDDSFTILPGDKKKGITVISIGNTRPPGKAITIRYEEVVELEGKDTFLSFFPDPEQTPFGEWAAVTNLNHGVSVDIDLLSGEQLFGVVLKTSDSDLTIMMGNETLPIRRDSVRRILLARRDTPGAKRILKGAGNGVGAVKPSRSIIDVVLIPAAATTGAVVAAGKRWPNDRLLIYAK